MGTNYYHRTNICSCCGRYEETHICKSLNSFEAVTRWLDEPPYGRVIEIGSWQEWKARLLDPEPSLAGQVWDEYGEQISVEEFIERVEATDPEWRRRQFTWMVNNAPAEVSSEPRLEKTWLDPDGFTFSGRSFS